MGVYKIYNHIECKNCDHSFTSGEFPQKLEIKYEVVYDYTRWGPELLECPKCKHPNKHFRQKPFYKMRWYEKGWTLIVLLFVALFHGLFIATVIGGLLFAMFYFASPSNSEIEYHQTVILILFLTLYLVFDYFNNFFQSDNTLK